MRHISTSPHTCLPYMFSQNSTLEFEGTYIKRKKVGGGGGILLKAIKNFQEMWKKKLMT